MAKSSLSESDVGKPVGPLLQQARSLMSAYSGLVKGLERCLIRGALASEVTTDPFCVQRVLSEAERHFNLSSGIDQKLLSDLKAWSAEQRKTIEQSFESRLRVFCDTNNVKLDGHFPSYLLNGFLKLQVNSANGACYLGDKQFDSLLLDSFASTILASMLEEAQRPFEKHKFIEELSNAYSRAIALSKASADSAIPVKDVFLELVLVKQSSKFAKAPSKSNFQDYPKEFFLRDLAKLVSAGNLATASRKRLVLAPTAFSADAFPILEAGAVRYIGRIAFVDSPD